MQYYKQLILTFCLSSPSSKYYHFLAYKYNKNIGAIIFEEFSIIKGVLELCIEGLVEGKRSKGRPRRRWTDDLREWSMSKTTQETFTKIKGENPIFWMC